MIRAWQIELGAAAVLAFATPFVADAAIGATADRGRRIGDLLRPLLMPSLWAHLDAASRAADPAERIAAGRVVTGLVPGWTDGTIHFAWTRAFELPRDRPERDALVDLLLAVDWLRSSAAERLAAGAPEDAAELLLAAATIVQHRATTAPSVAERIRSELGRDPADVAHDLVAEAVEVATNEATRARLAFATLRLIAGAIRMGDLPRAEQQRRLAQEQLRSFAGRADADLALASLEELGPLRSYLDEPGALEALSRDPLLSEIADALRARRR